jgi:glucokinase
MAVFAVDVGGTRIKLGLVENGRVLARTWVEARSDEGLAAALPRIKSALIGLSAEPVDGVGMAFPSLVSENRIIGDVGKFLDAEQLDLSAWARQEFDAHFAVDCDARMAAVGEWQYGAGRGTTDMVMVTLGTGIGTGVISEGKILRGKHGAAGVLGGHMTARIGGKPCPCGNVGCWETEASTAALPTLGEGFSDYATVFSSSEPHAVSLREKSLAAWGALAVSLIHAYDPEVLVFGGGVMASGEMVLGPIRRAVQKHAWTPWGSPQVLASELKDDAALVACEWLLKEGR